MAQSGYTPILIYGSGTPGNAPSAGNLTSSSAGAELALNYSDGKLFYKDAGGSVQVLATKGAGTIGGSNTQVQFNNSGALAGSANLTFDGTKLTAAGLNVSGLTVSTALALDASKNVVSVTNTGTGNNVLATSPVLTTPNLGTPSALTLTNATGLPIAGITGLGTGVGTALAVNVGSAGAVVLNGGALGTPSSGVVTNLTGTASININGTVGATTPTTGAFTTLSASGTTTLSDLTASQAVFTDASKNLVSVATTGTGNAVLATSPVLTTPNLGTPSAATLTNATGLPVSTGISGLGTGVATALAVNTGAAGAFVVNGGALGTPSSGTVTNLTGTASININGTVGATTPNTGAFTTLSASGVATFSAGTAAAPALTTIGDTDTGVFFPAANAWAVATGGVQALAVDSAGGLSVRGSATLGSTTIAGNTQVNLASGTTDYTSLTRYSSGIGELRHYGTGAFQLVTHGAANMLLYTNNQERMRISSGGDVGIGTTSPAYRLDVANGFSRIGAFNTQSFPASENSLGGAVFGWNRSAGSAQVTITNVYDNAPLSFEFAQKTGASTANVLYAFGNSNHQWYTGGSERMRIDSAGSVGIGDTALATSRLFIGGLHPSSFAQTQALRISGVFPATTTSEAISVLSRPSTATATYTLSSLVHFYANPDTFGAGSTVSNQYGFVAESTLTAAGQNFGFYGAIAAGTGRWNFYAAGTAPNYFAGDVGIGTTSPTARLHVSGSGSQYVLAQTTDTTGSAIGYVGAQFGASTVLQMRAGLNYTYLVSNGTTDPLLFGTNAQERMRIDSSGNVGIGTTNPGDALDVVGSIRTSAELRLSNDQLVRWGTSDTATIIGKSGASGGYLKLSVNNEVARVKSEGQFRFIPRATDPGNAEAGDVYYNSGTNKLRVYNGTAWVDLH